MTKELLEQYPDICGELEDLKKVITDTVSGSCPEPPYIKHTIGIRGIQHSEKIAQLEKQKREIEVFVDELEDVRLRRIIRLRAMEGLTWEQVAAKMGRGHSEDSVKKRYQRFFEKF